MIGGINIDYVICKQIMKFWKDFIIFIDYSSNYVNHGVIELDFSIE